MEVIIAQEVVVSSVLSRALGFECGGPIPEFLAVPRSFHVTKACHAFGFLPNPCSTTHPEDIAGTFL